jgi:phosphoribosylaminoimidazolecarboxamide formyltransferase/IMP cyclohydrolase
LAGKELSYNNILDLDAAWRTVSSFNEPTVVIVKHLTPTGVATDENLAEAYRAALASDPVSAFGGIIALNRAVDVNFVEALESIFLEAIAAPDFTPEAEALLIARRKNCRLVKITQPYDGSEIEVRSVHRGLLIQQVDMGDPEDSVFRVVTKKQPSMEELNTLKFAWNVVQHVKSNAIVLAQPNKTVGVGGGLPSRVDAVEIAIKKAANATNGAVMASDAFFPFADGIEAAIKAGVVAVIQPGGSIRDNEVLQAANDAGITMIFTGTRHFRH